MIYLASPYSAKSRALRSFRYKEVRKAVFHFISRGFPVFSPIVYLVPFEKHLPDNFPYQDIDDTWLRCAEQLWVLKLPLWESSRGVTHEIAVAKLANIPISYLEWPRENL